MTYKEIKKSYEKNNYKFFDEGNYNLNIFAIRSKNSISDKFDDFIGVAYKHDGLEKVRMFKATTDPGKYWLINPMRRNGTIIMVPGQYRGAYKVGIHGRSWSSGGYKALEQVKPMSYVRDNNKNSKLDLSLYRNPRNIFSGVNKTNLHRASAWKNTLRVGKYSAGCQVIQDPKDFAVLMNVCNVAKKYYGNSFTYTLFEQGEL